MTSWLFQESFQLAILLVNLPFNVRWALSGSPNARDKGSRSESDKLRSLAEGPDYEHLGDHLPSSGFNSMFCASFNVQLSQANYAPLKQFERHRWPQRPEHGSDSSGIDPGDYGRPTPCRNLTCYIISLVLTKQSIVQSLERQWGTSERHWSKHSDAFAVTISIEFFGAWHRSLSTISHRREVFTLMFTLSHLSAHSNQVDRCHDRQGQAPRKA